MSTARNKNGYVTVQSGDSLWKIARDNGIRYWRNVYCRGENASFRAKRPDPNKIFPGDSVYVPPPDEVEVMEGKPNHKYNKIPLYAQDTLETCWRAAGKMLYAWKFPGDVERKFNARIGENYQRQETYLLWADHPTFYKDRLHMEVLVLPGYFSDFNALHYTLAVHGPVIMILANPKSQIQHAIVVIGYNLLDGIWYYVDPYNFNQQLEFSPMDVMNPKISQQSVTQSLVPGATTPENMVKKLAIADKKLMGFAAWYRK